jgi:hypothetical protein
MAFEYKIITGTASEVEERVNELFNLGWSINGGLCYQLNASAFPARHNFAQSMIKYVAAEVKK